MNKELEKAVTMFKNLDMGNDEEFKRARNRILKKLERLQEENNKLEKANKTYINSIQSITPVLLENYIEKDKIRNKLEQDKENYIDAIHADNKVEAVQKYITHLEKELLEGK